nr:ribonuclease H-like domain, reverse transcriptase, RNA-dependent DNA polymerase [Tanacetum cinerariifolium]
MQIILEANGLWEMIEPNEKPKQITKRTKPNKQSNLVKEDLESTLLMAILEDEEEQNVSLHEEDVGYIETNKDSLWYLDNGASNHMTGIREHFKELDEKVSGKVRFRDGSYIKIKGKAYAKVPSQDLTKLDNRSIKMVYLGNEQGSKAYRLFDPTTQRVCVSRDVKFKEDETWDWKDYISEHTDDEPKWTNFKIGDPEVTYEHHDQRTQIIEDDNEFPNNNNEDYASPTTYSPLYPQTPHTPTTQSSENTEELLLAEDEPKNYKEASSDQKWIEAMKAELDFINRNNTWELTTLPTGHKEIGLKWVFKTKKDANGDIIKHKARLVAKGYIQQHGIDFEEVFAPVARIETMRLPLAIAATNKWEVHHLDVKSAFLHGDLKEEVYVTQPEGFIKDQNNGKVYRLIKALYGLRQAPRAWNIKLDNTLKSLDFKKCALEQAIYTKTSKDSTLLIGVYVDDLIITGTPKKEIDKFKAQMEEKFAMSDLGLLAYYLGIEVTQTIGDISIKQSAYASKILKEARMIDYNETLIPMDPGIRLTKNTEGTMVNSTEYRSLIGCLRYLLHTRPDLRTKDYGITYKHNRGNKIHGFSNSSYGVNTQEGKGTASIIFYYGESPISWSTQKQATVALSSCESEFIATTAAATQALWLKRLLSKLTHSQEDKITIQVDNKSAIALMKNPVFHGRSKHIDTKYNFIRECVEREDIQVEFVNGKYQKADILTKALPKIRFLTMRQLIGLKDLGSSALSFVEYDSAFSEDEKQQAKVLKISCNLNNAACKLKLRDYKQAVKLCTKVLDADSKNVKALYRRAQAYIQLVDLDLAETDIKKALEIDPDNRDVKLEYKLLKEKVKEYNKKDAQFYGNIFAKMNQLEHLSSANGTRKQEAGNMTVDSKA